MVIILWFLISIVVASIAEYIAHRWVMHKKIGGFLYREHTHQHHGLYYKNFDFESDPVGKHVNLKFSWYSTGFFFLIFAPIGFFSLTGMFVFWFTAILHNQLWNLVHSEMHLKEGRFFSKWAVFRYLKWNHFIHHLHNNKNYNAVLPPLGDFLFGTSAKPTANDLRKWYDLQTN